MNAFSQISSSSKVPKYQQLVNTLLSDIETGVLKSGDRLPSINEASEECYLSRDTVERAYAELHRLGVITSIFRKGYFITGKNPKMKTKVFFLVGRMTDANKVFFNAFMDSVGKNVIVDVFTYNYKNDNFREIINNHLGNYHYYVVMPHLVEDDAENIKTLKKITGERLLLIDNPFPTLGGNHSSLWSDVRSNLFSLLAQNKEELRKYERLSLVLSNDDYFDAEILRTFPEFCEACGFEFEIMDGLVGEKIEKNTAYFVMDDIDLVEVIKQAQPQGWTLGKEVGVVSFGDSCFKEILAGGITAISYQPEEFGNKAAQIVHGTGRMQEAIPMAWVQRASI
jgi:DNA-binding transcriptional regulator YhcF (GntR family)